MTPKANKLSDQKTTEALGWVATQGISGSGITGGFVESQHERK